LPLFLPKNNPFLPKTAIFYRFSSALNPNAEKPPLPAIAPASKPATSPKSWRVLDWSIEAIQVRRVFCDNQKQHLFGAS
jgi:hypothetical protein